MKLRFALLSLMLAAAMAASAAAPKYVFYFIGDGMGVGPANAAEMYNRQALGNAEPITMYQFPVASLAMTYSASSPVTDSAAAGTALSTGSKTANGMLGVTPDSVAAVSIARTLKERGWGVGIVTSVSADDATPGAFYAHVPSRKMYETIGWQGAASGYDIIAGAGLKADSAVVPAFREAGYAVARGPRELARVKGDKLLLLNTAGTPNWNIGYAIDSVADVLTLPMMTRAAIDHLRRVSPEGFFLMVEGGNIDHALHANDGGAAIKEVLNFNEAIALAYDFYRQHPDETLIVVTADHDTGGMSVGNTFRHYDATLRYADAQRVSKEAFDVYCRSLLDDPEADSSWEAMKAYLTRNLGLWGAVPVTKKQEKALREKFDQTFRLRHSADQKTLYANFNAFAAEVYRVWNDAAGIGFVTTHHTGNPVPVFAVGPGAEAFSSINNNIDIPAKILTIVGAKH